jgi:hypothetical protein
VIEGTQLVECFLCLSREGPLLCIGAFFPHRR